MLAEAADGAEFLSQLSSAVGNEPACFSERFAVELASNSATMRSAPKALSSNTL
jgi:hypothetical protein